MVALVTTVTVAAIRHRLLLSPLSIVPLSQFARCAWNRVVALSLNTLLLHRTRDRHRLDAAR